MHSVEGLHAFICIRRKQGVDSRYGAMPHANMNLFQIMNVQRQIRLWCFCIGLNNNVSLFWFSPSQHVH